MLTRNNFPESGLPADAYADILFSILDGEPLPAADSQEVARMLTAAPLVMDRENTAHAALLGLRVAHHLTVRLTALWEAQKATIKAARS